MCESKVLDVWGNNGSEVKIIFIMGIEDVFFEEGLFIA